MSAVVLFAGDLAACEQVVAEIGGGVGTFFGDSVALEHLAEGGKYYPDVAEECDFLDVLQVVGDFRFPGDGVAPAHLRKPAEALPYGVPPALFGGHEYHVAHELGPRPDYGHVALEDVEKFGQLVEAGGADEPEYPFALARAGLREEGVAMHLDGAEDGEHEQQRAQGENRGQRAAEVQGSFEEAGVHIPTI